SFSNLCGMAVEVTALEIDSRFEAYARKHFPNVQFSTRNIFDLGSDDRWDIVITSHTIEHVENPLAFIERLRHLAREFVLPYAPFEEQRFSPGHINRIDLPFLRTLPGIFWAAAIKSLGWRTEATSRTVIATLVSDSSAQLDALTQVQDNLDQEYGSSPLPV